MAGNDLEVATGSDALRAVATALHERIAPHLPQPHLEVEMRFCRFAVPAPPAQPTILPRGATKGKLTVGVSQTDFDVIVAHLTKAFQDDALPPTQQTTEDVQLRGTRYTYLLPPPTGAAGEAGAATLLQSVEKSRRLVEDIKMPRRSLYDMRLAVNTEQPALQPTAPTSPPLPPPPPPSSGPVKRGGPEYRRRKQRTTFTDGLYRYDCTAVQDSNGQQKFEVEVEGVFKSVQDELTEAWVVGLLSRMEALAALCSCKRRREADGGQTEASVASSTPAHEPKGPTKDGASA